MRTNTLSPVLVEIRTKAMCWIQESADTFHLNHQDSFIPPHGLQLTANTLPAKWSRYPDSRLLRQVGLTVVVWSMTLKLDVRQRVTLPKIAALAIFSPKFTRATPQLAFPVSLIHPPNPPRPQLASVLSRSCALLDYKGVWPGLDGLR